MHHQEEVAQQQEERNLGGQRGAEVISRDQETMGRDLNIHVYQSKRTLPW